MIEAIQVSLIRTDGGTQPRAGVTMAVVEEYVDALTDGAEFPPVKVVYDGQSYWLYDGFHRVEAHRLAQAPMIDANVIQGTVEDAKWLSFAANATHGSRRTTADKRRAVEAALLHPRGQKASDRGIAEHVGVSRFMVATVRGELVAGGRICHLETRVGQDGKEYPAQRKPEPAAEIPQLEDDDLLGPSDEVEKEEATYPQPNKNGDFLPWDAYEWEESVPEDPRLKDCFVRWLKIGPGEQYVAGWSARVGKRARVEHACAAEATDAGPQWAILELIEWVEGIYPGLDDAGKSAARALVRWIGEDFGTWSQEIDAQECDPEPELEPERPRLEVLPPSPTQVRMVASAFKLLATPNYDWLDLIVKVRAEVGPDVIEAARKTVEFCAKACRAPRVV